MENNFIQLMKSRRSVYNLTNQLPFEEELLVKKLEEVIVNTPTAFNSQSSKAVLLVGDNHKKLWNEITLEILQKVTPPEVFPNTTKKINSFANAYGTILFFDDANITNDLAEKYSLYKDMFLPWSEHSNGMLQFAVWMMLSSEGIGASLQHYNPIIDEKVKNEFNIDPNWRLVAQMPFGMPAEKAGPKTSKDAKELLKVIK